MAILWRDLLIQWPYSFDLQYCCPVIYSVHLWNEMDSKGNSQNGVVLDESSGRYDLSNWKPIQHKGGGNFDYGYYIDDLHIYSANGLHNETQKVYFEPQDLDDTIDKLIDEGKNEEAQQLIQENIKKPKDTAVDLARDPSAPINTCKIYVSNISEWSDSITSGKNPAYNTEAWCTDCMKSYFGQPL